MAQRISILAVLGLLDLAVGSVSGNELLIHAVNRYRRGLEIPVVIIRGRRRAKLQ